GFLLGYTGKKVLTGIARSTGVDEFAEGTAFERIAESFGTSTAGIVATTVAWFVYLSGILLALQVLEVDLFANTILIRITNYVPNIIAAAFITIFGAILADKAAIYVSERLEGVKVSEVSQIPSFVKYTIIFIAVLMALSQLGISTTALHILLAVVLIGVMVIVVVALRNMVSSAVSGLYILMTQPYSIGDRVRVGEVEGVVQEIDMFTTRLEDDGREYVVPNYEVFEKGVSRKIQ
ncbi:MAG: mechanosensitive ion channel, partial [Halobacteria archaeon]|nr:mechanosensitive ion channel [Halobacteria archaeon]